MEINVGEFRRGSAYVNAKTPIVLTPDSKEDDNLKILVQNLQIVEMYPETDGTFKIVVKRRIY